MQARSYEALGTGKFGKEVSRRSILEMQKVEIKVTIECGHEAEHHKDFQASG